MTAGRLQIKKQQNSHKINLRAYVHSKHPGGLQVNISNETTRDLNQRMQISFSNWSITTIARTINAATMIEARRSYLFTLSGKFRELLYRRNGNNRGLPSWPAPFAPFGHDLAGLLSTGRVP